MHSGFTTLSLTHQHFTHAISVLFEQCHYRIHSNSMSLLTALEDYFAGYLNTADTAKVNVYLFDDTVRSVDIPWQNWTAEAGKTRLKEQYYDAEDGRWIHKYKTGMVLFQHLTSPVAVGPCQQHLSQTVNFIINQHINHLQQHGGLICHAACLSIQQQGVAIAALSGGGKSTTMLKLMELNDSQFVSNDRLFLSSDGEGVIAKGVAKQPRVNPGTLLHNPRLRSILPEARQVELQKLSPEDLWQIEEKYDVMVAQYYGEDKLGHQTPLHHVVLLNWQPGSCAPVVINQISLNDKPELIPAIAKSPGSFYQNAQGEFLKSAMVPENSRYQQILGQTRVWEVSGGANFETLIPLLTETLAL